MYKEVDYFKKLSLDIIFLKLRSSLLKDTMSLRLIDVCSMDDALVVEIQDLESTLARRFLL